MASCLLQRLKSLQERYERQDTEEEDLVSKIVEEITEKPGNEYIPALLKGCLSVHEKIQKKCSKEMRRKAFQHQLNNEWCLNANTFQIFYEMMCSRDDRLHKLVAACFYSLSETLKDNNESEMDALVDLLKESGIISLCLESMPSRNYRAISIVHHFVMSSFKFKEICVQLNIFNYLEPLFKDHTLSHTTFSAISAIFYEVADKLLQNDCMDQVIKLLRLQVFHEENYVIVISLSCLCWLANSTNLKNENVIERILSNENTKSMRQYFYKKAKCDKLLFDKTMQKYLEQHCDFEVPIVIKRLIENYYIQYTVKKVDKMEFNLLKRLIELMDGPYCGQLKLYSLQCMKEFVTHPDNSRITPNVQQMSVNYGFLSQLTILLNLKDRKIQRVGVRTILPLMLTNLNDTFDMELFSALKVIATGTDLENVQTCIWIFAYAIVGSAGSLTHFLKLCRWEVIPVLIDALKYVVEKKVCVQDLTWSLVHDSISAIQNYDDDGITTLESMQRHFETYDQSKVLTENKRQTEQLINRISTSLEAE